jgi:hypothetical protein
LIDKNSSSVENQLISYGIEIGFLISGFFGALMMVSKSATQRIGPTIASLLAGTACANYLTPVIMHFLPEKVQGQGKYAVAFMMGFMGLKGLELVIEKYMKAGKPKDKAAPAAGRKVKKVKKANKIRKRGKKE